jgi:glycosyltransferase involved in cell wall biosynthesis
MGGAEKLVSLLCDEQFQSKDEVFEAFELEGPKSLLGLYRLVKKKRKESLRSDIELILHAHLTKGIYYTALVSILIKVQCILTEHNTTNLRRSSIFWPIELVVYSRFSKFICISNKVKSNLQCWLKLFDEGKYVVVYNGIESLGLRKTSFTPEKLRLLSIGSLTHQKGFDRSISMLSDCADLWSRYSIVGEGPLRADLTEQIQNHKSKISSNEILLAGYKADIYPFISDCDVLLLSSRWEGFGLVVIEALSTGTPVLVADIEGVGEISNDSIGFYKYDASNTASLIAALKKVTNHLTSKPADIKTKTTIIAERFKIDTMVSNYLKVYNEL